VRKIGLGSRRGSWWVNFPLLGKHVGRTRRRISYHRTGTSSSVSEVTSTLRDSHLFVSHIRQREADSSVGGSSVFDLERSNREGSGSFSIARFLLPSFLELPFPFGKQEFVDRNP
jgi:hypothetical protein